jgi:uncharacterized membrane protein
MTDNTNTRPAVASITEAEIQDGKTMAILAYIIWIIPLIAARDQKFAMYHTEQAIMMWIVTIIAYIIVFVLSVIFSQISTVFTCIFTILFFIVWLFLIILAIMGIINAAGGKIKELPIIGSYGTKLNLVK